MADTDASRRCLSAWCKQYTCVGERTEREGRGGRRKEQSVRPIWLRCAIVNRYVLCMHKLYDAMHLLTTCQPDGLLLPSIIISLASPMSHSHVDTMRASNQSTKTHAGIRAIACAPIHAHILACSRVFILLLVLLLLWWLRCSAAWSNGELLSLIHI